MMNQRIQILAKQAGISTNHDIGLLISDPDKWVNHFSEKFAELIVQECVRYFNEDYQRDFDTRWREDLSNGIKNHFGVEE